METKTEYGIRALKQATELLLPEESVFNRSRVDVQLVNGKDPHQLVPEDDRNGGNEKSDSTQLDSTLKPRFQAILMI